MDELFRLSARSVNGVLHGEPDSVRRANQFIPAHKPQTAVFDGVARHCPELRREPRRYCVVDHDRASGAAPTNRAARFTTGP